jgi:hypothetical protein
MVTAVGKFHSFEQVHGDFTVENILIVSNSTVRIVDFGLHRILGPNYQPRALPSIHRPITPRYEPKKFMPGSWALGAILLPLCVLRPLTKPPLRIRDVPRVIAHFPHHISNLMKRVLNPFPDRGHSLHKILKFIAHHHCGARRAGVPATPRTGRGKLPQRRPVQESPDARRGRNIVVDRTRIQFCGLEESDVGDEPKPPSPLQDGFMTNLESPGLARRLHHIDDTDDLPTTVSPTCQTALLWTTTTEQKFLNMMTRAVVKIRCFSSSMSRPMADADSETADLSVRGAVDEPINTMST